MGTAQFSVYIYFPANADSWSTFHNCALKNLTAQQDSLIRQTLKFNAYDVQPVREGKPKTFDLLVRISADSSKKAFS